MPIPTIDLEMTQHEEAQKMTFHDNQPDEPATAAEDHKPQMYDFPNCIAHKLRNSRKAL